MTDIQGDSAGVQPGGIDPSRPGLASQICPPGYVWLGDCAGWEIVPVVKARDLIAETEDLGLELRHRCGWAEGQPFDGITGDGAAYVGNLIERLLEIAPVHACITRPRSPEHAARVQRWQDQSSAAPRPVTDTPDTPSAFVPGVLRTIHDHNGQTSASGHGPEDYPEPANIPVRREVDGKWQTVEVTLSDFRANEGADGRQPYRVTDGGTD